MDTMEIQALTICLTMGTVVGLPLLVLICCLTDRRDRRFQESTLLESIIHPDDLRDLFENEKDDLIGVYHAWGTKLMKSLVGTAFKVTVKQQDFVVTAAHVISSTADTYLQAGDFSVRIPYDHWIRVATDAVALRLDRAEYSELRKSVKSLRVGCSMGIDVQAKSAHPHRNTSVGILRPASNSEKSSSGFGGVIYTGKTRPGFSGAPYVVGNVVHGMHLQTGAIANGYSMSYLASLIARNLESSEDELVERMLLTARKSDVVWQAVGAGDEWQLKCGNRYVVVDDDCYMKAASDPRFKRFFYDDESFEEDYGTVKQGVPEMESKMDALIATVNHLVGLMEDSASKLAVAQGKIKDLDVVQGLAIKHTSEMEERLEVIEQRPFLDRQLADLTARISLLEKGSPTTTDSLQQNIDHVQDMLASLQEDMDGLFQHQMQSKGASKCICDIDSKRVETMLLQQKKNLIEFVELQVEPIRTDLDVLRAGQIQPLTSTSTTSSEPWIQKVPQDLVTSRNTQQSETPSATESTQNMDSLFEEFWKWRLSADLSNPDYSILRGQWFKDQAIGEEDARRIINRTANRLKKMKLKALKSAEVPEAGFLLWLMKAEPLYRSKPAISRSSSKTNLIKKRS